MPQGSVLSMTLFAVAIRGMVEPSVATLLYADNIAICCIFCSIIIIKDWLQVVINHMSH